MLYLNVPSVQSQVPTVNLTLTNVVFELLRPLEPLPLTSYLTLTNVVFELIINITRVLL